MLEGENIARIILQFLTYSMLDILSESVFGIGVEFKNIESRQVRLQS